MSEEQITYKQNSREAILRGVDLLADAMKVTLGPNRRDTELIKKLSGRVDAKHGSGLIAKQIELGDPYENLGAQMVREVVSKVSDAGGGATTATVLAQSIFAGGVRAVAAGANPWAVQRGIKVAAEIVLAELLKRSQPVSGQLITDVASMAANGDRAVGEIVAKAIQEAGANGLIMVEESRTTWTEVRAASGLRFDRGYISPYFMTDPERLTAVLDDPYILLYEEKISDLKTLLPLLEQIAPTGKPLLIIAEDVVGEALASLVVNKLRGTLQVCAVKTPQFGDRRKAVLEDMAIFTGGRAITEETGLRPEQIRLEHCGRARKVTVSRYSAIIIDAAGRTENIEERAQQLHAELDQTTSDYDRQKLTERLTGLAGKAVVIAAGANTEAELKEKRASIEDALQAAQSAIEEGIVPGGGVALLRASNALNSLELGGDEQIGVALLKQACEAPVRQIARNAGFEGGFVTSRLRSTEDWNVGFNVVTGEFEDLMQAGIVDSAKIARSTLRNASFVASELLSSEPIPTDLADEALPPRPAQAPTPVSAPTPAPSLPHAKPPMAPAPPAPPPPVAEAPQGPEPPGPSQGFSGNDPAQYVNFDFLDKRELPFRSLDLHEGLYTNLSYKLVIGIGLQPDKRATGTQAPVHRPEREEVTLDVVLAMPFNLKWTTGAWKLIQWPALGPSTVNAEFDVESGSPGIAGAKVLIYHEHQLLFCGDLRICVQIEPDDWTEGKTAIYWDQLTEQKAASLSLFKEYRLLDREHRRSLNISVHRGASFDEYDLVFFFRRKNESPPGPAAQGAVESPAAYPLTIKLSAAEVTNFLARTRLALRGFMDDPAVKQSGSPAGEYSGAYRSGAKGAGENEALAYAAGQELLKSMTVVGAELRRKLFGSEIGQRLENMLASEIQEDGAIIQVWIENNATDFLLPWVWINAAQVEEAKKIIPDPRGFWGYKYIIEQIRHARQPSVEDHAEMSVRPLQLAGGIHNFITEAEHLKFFLDCRDLYRPAFQWAAVQDDEWSGFLEKCASHIVYLYCHGHTEQLVDAQFAEITTLLKKMVESAGTPDARIAEYLVLQQRKKIRSRSSLQIGNKFLTMTELEKFHPAHPSEAPLVFLNMCEATEFYPGMTDNFVDVFLERGARGVVGTEMPMLVAFGDLFARRFFQVFFSPAVMREKRGADGCAVGQVLWQLRREFMDNGNPMAFGYTYFGDATMRLKPPLARGGQG